MASNNNDCPCKTLPQSFSTLTAAEYGDFQSLINNEKKTRDYSSSEEKFNKVGPGGYTPLHLASQHGNSSIVAFLLSIGADVDVRTESGIVSRRRRNSGDDDGEHGATPLHRASFSGAVTCMFLLLGRGDDDSPLSRNSNVNNRFVDGYSAKMNGKGADLLAKDGSFGDQMTPLHKASAGGRYLAVKLLIEEGRRRKILRRCLEALDASGRTPLDVVREILVREEEERVAVQRWDGVAGGPADWKRCSEFLKAAQVEVGIDCDSSSSSFLTVREEVLSSEKNVLSLTSFPSLPDHMRDATTCLGCERGKDGRCVTASWEEAFRAALYSSSDSSSSSKQQGYANVTESKEEKLLSNIPAISDGSNSNKGLFYSTESGTNSAANACHNFGQICGECGVKSMALFRGSQGSLVCRKCQKSTRRRK